jgi:hypothetical protein
MEWGWLMDFERFFRRTPATLDEIKVRVTHALQRHPLCRGVRFDVVSTPRTVRGSNWTVSLHAVEPRALWEASEIVADIQDAYELAAMS